MNTVKQNIYIILFIMLRVLTAKSGVQCRAGQDSPLNSTLHQTQSTALLSTVHYNAMHFTVLLISFRALPLLVQYSALHCIVPYLNHDQDTAPISVVQCSAVHCTVLSIKLRVMPLLVWYSALNCLVSHFNHD